MIAAVQSLIVIFIVDFLTDFAVRVYPYLMMKQVERAPPLAEAASRRRQLHRKYELPMTDKSQKPGKSPNS